MKEWFKKAKLGLFIHYGIYAVKGVAESWSFYNGQISYEEYMEQAEGFTASKLDMKEWAEFAVAAGAKYAVSSQLHTNAVGSISGKLISIFSLSGVLSSIIHSFFTSSPFNIIVLRNPR